MAKTKKSFLPVLLALLMVVAFMPTMAFAAPVKADNGTWDLEAGTYEAADGTTYNIDRIEFDSTGKTTASVQIGTGSSGVVTYEVYDFNGATITKIGSDAVKKNYSYVDYSAFAAASDGLAVEITMAKPSYATGNSKATLETIIGWTLKGKAVALEESTEAQTGTISVLMTAKDTRTNANVTGTVSPLTVNVLGKPAENNLTYGKDKTNVDNAVEFTYNGTEQTIDAALAKDNTVEFAKFNTSTGKWDAVEALAFKDVQKVANYKATFKDKDGNEVAASSKTFTVEVKPATAFSFAWDKSVATGTVAVKADATPAEFINVENINSTDKATALEYFAEAYTIDVDVNKANAAKETWTVKKITDAAAKKALATKYETLLANYNVTDIPNFNGEVNVERAAAAVVANDQEEDINFLNAPNATYKIKKAKALKKNKTIAIKAESESGNTVTYALSSPTSKITINKTTGKITVKKGLKKGTYKVTVKAKTKAGNGYKAGKESVQLTIKIKK